MDKSVISRKLKSLRHIYLPIGLDESVFFFCLHKTASSLFDHYLLKHVKGLVHKSYATAIYLNQPVPNPLNFKSKGVVYGPIRISAEAELPVHTTLVKPCTDLNFIKYKKVFIMIRDPRDILVSSYYSYGYNHRLSPNPVIADVQQKRREKIQSQSIDEYVIESAKAHQLHFKTIQKLLNKCPRAVLLRYEDMVNNYEVFVESLQSHFKLSHKVVAELYQKSRPREVEDAKAHKRSGLVGDYKSKLKAETIDYLNQLFKEQLKKFNYSIST